MIFLILEQIFQRGRLFFESLYNSQEKRHGRLIQGRTSVKYRRSEGTNDHTRDFDLLRTPGTHLVFIRRVWEWLVIVESVIVIWDGI